LGVRDKKLRWEALAGKWFMIAAWHHAQCRPENSTTPADPIKNGCVSRNRLRFPGCAKIAGDGWRKGNYLGNQCELATQVLILALRGADWGAVANADTRRVFNLASHLFEESADPCLVHF
jgi:hypothetical protein